MDDWDRRPDDAEHADESDAPTDTSEGPKPPEAQPPEIPVEPVWAVQGAALPPPPPVYAPYAFRPVSPSPPAHGPTVAAPAAGGDQPRVAEPIDWPSGSPAVARPPKTAAVTDGSSMWAKVGEELVAWFKTLVSAAVYATLIVTFGFQVARVEGLSMAPTLEDQDRLIVNKLAYRLDAPQAGDIVMLYYPLDPSKSFVKRVIGEPGDVIKSINGQVYRNDVPLDDDFIPEEYRSTDTWGPDTIPEGYYFVMGDHRNNSSDSRAWKYVPRRYIIGKVQLRWWPIDEVRVF